MYDYADKKLTEEKGLSLRRKIKRSKFVLSLLGFVGYALYTLYAVYYYLSSENALGIVLLCLIGVAFSLSVALILISYRVNMMEKPRPALLRFMKMAKYAVSCCVRSLLWACC